MREREIEKETERERGRETERERERERDRERVVLSRCNYNDSFHTHILGGYNILHYMGSLCRFP